MAFEHCDVPTAKEMGQDTQGSLGCWQIVLLDVHDDNNAQAGCTGTHCN